MQGIAKKAEATPYNINAWQAGGVGAAIGGLGGGLYGSKESLEDESDRSKNTAKRSLQGAMAGGGLGALSNLGLRKWRHKKWTDPSNERDGTFLWHQSPENKGSDFAAIDGREVKDHESIADDISEMVDSRLDGETSTIEGLGMDGFDATYAQDGPNIFVDMPVKGKDSSDRQTHVQFRANPYTDSRHDITHDLYRAVSENDHDLEFGAGQLRDFRKHLKSMKDRW